MKQWTKKYQPEKISDIPVKETNKARDFVLNFDKNKKNALLIYGKTGVGKTAFAYALANELNYEIIEINCSEIVDKESVKDKVGNASRQRSLFSNGKIILIEEVDEITGKDVINAIFDVINKSKFPVLLTANNPWDSRLSLIRKVSELLEFKEVDELRLIKVLENICKNEKIEYDENVLGILSRRSGSDIRSAINDLYSLSLKGRISKEDLDGLYERERKENIFNVLKLIFKSRDIDNVLGILIKADVDLDEICLWIDENLPFEYKGEELVRAYEKISKADVFNGRISRKQYYRFLVYVDALLSVGVALAKNDRKIGFVGYKRTDRILKLWIANKKYARKKSIAGKIAVKTHCSTRRVLNEFGYYKNFLDDRVFNELELNDDEIEYLRGKF